MVDNGDKILVEFDYDNISLIDPNKVIDEEGKVKDRLVKQENLVMYANLECNVMPRTKLALGSALNDNIRTVSLAKINFLNPGHKKFMDNSWTDEITGKNTVEGKGVNQPRLKSVQNPNKSDDFYITQSLSSNGTPGAVDNGLLGITSIQVDVDTSFYPQVSIQLEDVKGRALFEGGNNSPYAAFFQLPYPIFYLTLKGYYGKAVRMPLMLQEFSSSFDGTTGNFKVSLKMFGYKYGIMSYINWGHMLAVPHMYKTFVNTTQPTNNSEIETSNSTTQNNTQTQVTVPEEKPQAVSRGYEKMKEVYSEYKAKGLIDDDFPEYTIFTLRDKLNTFIKDILEKFTKENLGPLTEIDNYQTLLTDLQKKIFFDSNSWYKKYMDTKFPITLLNDKKVYRYKKEIDTEQERKDIQLELEGILGEGIKKLNSNSVCGKNGSYTVGGKTTKSQIPINIETKNFQIQVTPEDVNYEKTYLQLNGKKLESQIEVDEFKTRITSEIERNNWFIFDGKNRFNGICDETAKNVKTLRTEIEQKITDSLAEQLAKKDSGIGFKPTIRNILAVFFAQGEAFLRLMDDVHSEAWDVRDNPYRKAAIQTSATAKSVDVKNNQDNDPIYPWPQVIVEKLGDDDQEKFECKYPGDPKISSLTKAYVSELWPEVEFVEEYIKGFITREGGEPPIGDTNNQEQQPARLSLNALDFPISNEVFQNKEEVKFYYEIYERVLMNTFYSRFSRVSGYDSSIYSVESENEKLNALKALGETSPFLQKKLKQYLIDSGNYLTFLRHISNQGEGQSWQTFIRGDFVTPYLKNKAGSPYQLFNENIIDSPRSQPNLSLDQQNKITSYIEEKSDSNTFEFSDMYPITNLEWAKNYLSNGNGLNGVNDIFNTNKVLVYNTKHKTITNFKDGDDALTKRPISNFNYTDDVWGQNVDLNFENFYNNREPKEQFITEGNVTYSNYNGNLSENQTTSIFNTPYFINAIQQGVFKFRYDTNDLSSYKVPAYLFLNSLPLATLREKYKTKNASEDLDYIVSTLKKFGGVHKLPYVWVLKYGSIWHRYKTFNREGKDILDDCWKDFNYLENYDPVFSSATKTYNLNINNQPAEIVLTDDISGGANYTTQINSGFYPKLYDDMNVFFQGLKLYSGSTQLNGTCDIFDDTLVVYSVNDNNLLSGETLAGANIDVGTTIVSQVNGTTGGPGIYKVDISQNLNKINGICNISDNVLEVISITGGTLQPNQQIGGEEIIVGTKILNEITGGTNPNNIYNINNSQNVTGATFFVSVEGDFLVVNAQTSGYGQQETQDLIDDDKIVLTTNESARIYRTTGFDPNNTNRNLNFTSWSAIVKETDGESYYPLPSFGYTQNQTKDDCFKNNKLKVEVAGNPAVFNGSTRLFWGAPNYGYFDNSRVSKPDPDSYLKQVFNEKAEQQNFLITGEKNNYTKISEIFTTFETNVLDYFEEEFLNFSRSIYDYKTLIPGEEGEETETDLAIKNFQFLMRVLFKINKPTSIGSPGLVNEVITKQKEKFKSVFNKLMSYDVVLKLGNPTMFNKRLFYTFSTKYIEDPITYQGYNQGAAGALPTAGGTITLAQSKAIYPETWKDLEYYVGFSEIPELVYSDNGSYITDFFVDMNVQFNQKNVKDFAPIIKLYATQKLLDNSLDISKFFTLMNTYLDTCELYLNNTIDNLMTGIRNDLPDIVITKKEEENKAPLVGDQSRDELWDSFKSLNDTWISGYDLKNKTLFEDILLYDRACRDIGQKVLADIFKVKDLIDQFLVNGSMENVIKTIIQQNNFNFFPLPYYSNFYNAQDAVKNAVPKPEGTSEFASSLWGTFLNVDYRDTSPKYLCYYRNVPSNHLDLNDNIDYRFRDDAFDLRRASDNPLLENQINKTNWDKSNKIAGFNVDFSNQNQQIFENFNLQQTVGKPTAESLEMINQMANISRNRGTGSQSASLYNIYKNRAYECSIDMMGNALMQPMMYFNLRNIPMFSGPYMITKINHSISNNEFKTTIQGTRQPFYDLPKIDNFIQSLTTNILSNIKDQIQKQNEDIKKSPENVISEINSVVSNARDKDKLTTNQNCSDNLNPAYQGYTISETPQLTNINAKDFSKTLKDEIVKQETNQNTISQFSIGIFVLTYMDSGEGTTFKGYENNFSSISLTKTYGAGFVSFVEKQYFCITKGNNINEPQVKFTNLESYMKFAISKYKSIDSSINYDEKQKLIDTITDAFVTKWPIIRNGNVYGDMTEQDKTFLKGRAKKALDIYESLN